MHTAPISRETRHHETVDVRASVKSIQDNSKDAIAKLDAMIAQDGEYTDLATEMRDVYVGFNQLAEDIRATSDFVDAASHKA